MIQHTPFRPWVLPLLVGAAVLLLAPPRSSAQRLPGMPGSQGGTAEQNMAEYYAHVMQQIAGSMETWRDAWAADDAESLAEHYSEDAVLVFPRSAPVWGRDGIRDALPGRLTSVGQAQAAIGDVKASGRIAYVGGNFQIEVQDGPRAGERITGFHSTVFYRVDDDWLIRSQVFHADPENADDGG